MNFMRMLLNKYVAMVIIALWSLMSIEVLCKIEDRCNVDIAAEQNAAGTKMLSDQEREYIFKLVKEIESVFEDLQKKIELFIDLRDKTPYRKFVGDLCARIDLFVRETLDPLEQRIKEEPVKEAPFCRGLYIVDELLKEFLAKLHAMRVVLLKYVSAKDNPEQAFKLATELEPHLTALIAKEVWNKLESKLRQVESLMKQIDERDIIIILAQLRVVLEASQRGSSSLKISPTTVLTCIRRKIRYN